MCHAADRRFDLVTTDVDGTLLSSKNELSARNEEAIAECIKLGVPVSAILPECPTVHAYVQQCLHVQLVLHNLCQSSTHVICSTICRPILALCHLTTISC